SSDLLRRVIRRGVEQEGTKGTKGTKVGLPKLDRIEDVIAADVWEYQDRSGRTVTSRIEIGRPQPIPDDEHGDFYCPVFVEHWSGRVVSAGGAGPVDALMNAVRFVRTFAVEIGYSKPDESTSA
ncbi:MAG: hypothetical protein KY476_11230, partial [Planctomycetes bacterium]|nr:hypothetical protein [Planctomycetota bacterium]